MPAHGGILLWDVKTGEELHVLSGHAGLVLRLTFSKDDTRLASARFAKVCNVTSGEEPACLYGNISNVFGAAFGPDGTARTYFGILFLLQKII